VVRESWEASSVRASTALMTATMSVAPWPSSTVSAKRSLQTLRSGDTTPAVRAASTTSWAFVRWLPQTAVTVGLRERGGGRSLDVK
jgi:hypothetical protein